MDGDTPSPRPVSNHPNAVRPSVGAEDDLNIPEPARDTEPLPKVEPIAPDYHKKPKRNKHPFLIILTILLVALGGIYWFWMRPAPASAPTKTANPKTSDQATAIDNNSAAETEHYNSVNFNLEFDYPKGWKLSDVDNSGVLTVTSPAMKLKDTLGEEVTGQVMMTLRDKDQKLTEFKKGNAEAVLDSKKVDYTKPTTSQRGSTYLSFLNYASSPEVGIDGVYITGDAGYKKDQAIPSVDIARIDPVIDVIFLECVSEKCTGTDEPLTIATESWQESGFATPIEAMLKSFAIQ